MATLVSVNVGLPRDVPWHGKTVHTGVWKSAVEGPRMARRLNIDGDGQGDLGGHGGEFRAIYVYQLDSYDYWADQMGRDDFVHGQFGENFTVTGLADDEVCIGDRYRVGDAVVEVTQPRVTCYRVGIRMDEPRMAALLTSSGRTGFYLRVLEEGLVEAGQEIVKLADGPEQMTVAEANALLYRPQHPRRSLQRALRIPALSPGWQASFQALLDAPPGGGNAGLTANAGPPPAWPSFRPARIVERRRESATVWSFVLELDAADPPDHESNGAAGLPGQFVTVRLRPDPDGPPVLRSYSLSRPPEQRRLQISVKREDKGVGSRYLVDRDRVGETIDVAAPRGGFILHPGTGPVVLWSAGIGATPVLAMLEALAAEHSDRDVWWLHGARNRAEHPFAVLVDDLLAGLPHAHRYVRYSRPGPDDRIGADYDAVGRLSAEAAVDLDHPARRRALPVRPVRLPRGALGRVGVDGCPSATRPHRDLRCGAGPRAGDRADSRAGTAPTSRSAGHRPARVVRPQRRKHALRHRLRQPAGAGRSLRRPGPLVVPDRRLPQLREQPARRRDRLLPRSDRRAGAGPPPHLLLTADLRGRPRPVAPRPPHPRDQEGISARNAVRIPS